MKAGRAADPCLKVVTVMEWLSASENVGSVIVSVFPTPTLFPTGSELKAGAVFVGAAAPIKVKICSKYCPF